MRNIMMAIMLMPAIAMALELSPSFMPEAVARYKVKAEAGDAEAQFLYAWALTKGTPVRYDTAVAFDCAKKSAGQGFELAYRLVGLGYAEGWSGTSNAVEAAVWYGKFFAWAKPAAEKGNAWAQLQLGQCYERGCGIEKDAKEAVKWYRKAAEQGCAIAQTDLARCYVLGTGVERDEKEELKWYRKAAEQGESQAQLLLGLCYRRGIGVETNHAEAMKWYRMAAEVGYRDAQYRLWTYYMYGEGVEKNLAEAVKWYCKMAQNDWKPGGYLLKTDELFDELLAPLIGEKGQTDNIQKVYESLVALGEGLKDCSTEVKTYYEKDLSFVKGRLDQDKQRDAVAARSRSKSALGRILPALGNRRTWSESEEDVDGYTWSYSVSNDGATIKSVSPKPTGDVSIPSTLGGVPVTEIAGFVFRKCEGLTSVTIPSSVGNRKVSGAVFPGCDALKRIIVEKDNQRYASVDGVLYTKDMTELVRCPGAATSITIPDGVTRIGTQAFSLCKGLTSITLPHSVTNIGAVAFDSCTGLKSVTIPSSVTSIGSSAFFGCSGLKSVTIPSGVTYIGGGAFATCAKLSQINVESGNQKYVSVDGVLYTKDLKELVQCPGGAKKALILKDVTRIRWCAFKGCKDLASITIPTSVVSIGSSAFSGCSGLTSVTIPENVTSIGRYAFSVCTELRQINVEEGNQNYVSIDGVLYAKDMAKLIQCPGGATSIAIPKGVTSIGEDAFSGCSGLTSVTIPESVTSIGSSAFNRCSGLKSVTIPSSVTSIGGHAFSGCSGLADSDGFVIINDILYGYHGNAVAVTIPSNVTNIVSDTFYGCSELKSVTIPSGVSEVGRWAFDGCTGLTSVTFCGECPRSIAFLENCKKLSAIHVPANARSWEGMTEWQGIPLVFDGVKVDEKIESGKPMQSGKTSVAGKLQECDFLLNKDFKKSAKFYLCLFSASWCPPCRREMPRIAKTYAETLKDDPDIELIHFSRDRDAEKAMAWAKEHDVKFPVVKPNGGNPLELHCNGIPHLFIVKADGTLLEEGHPMRIFNEEKFREIKSGSVKPRTPDVNLKNGERTEQVDGYTWSYRVENGVAKIRSVSPKPSGRVSIPPTLGGVPVKEIGDYVFSGCRWLESVMIPSSVTGIASSAFRSCGKLTKIVVDVDNPRYKSIDNCLLSKDGVTLIRGPGSRSVVIPKGVASIGDYAFSECHWLASVTIPEGVTNIGDCAFSACKRLISVTIPDGVTSIGRGLFYGSMGLMSVTIPEGVTSIGAEAFRYCHGLMSVTIPEGVTNIGSSAFSDCHGLTSVTIPEGVTSIGGGAFSDCHGLTSVTISAGVTNIGWYAFSGCSNLTSVTIPSSVTSIGNSAFSDCSGLASVTIPSSVTSIGRGAFDNTSFYEKQEKGMVILGGGVLYKFKGECSSSVTIPSRVTSIGDSAFSSCEGLMSVMIPSSVTSIGSSAFSRCNELTEIVVDVDNPRYKSIDNCLLSRDGVTLIRGSGSRSVVIPKDVTIIGGSAFSGCSRMTSVMIPSGVTSIGNGAFYDCHGLTSLTIPAGVTNIGFSAFSGCKGLTSVTIPSSVMGIGADAFYGCKGLASVMIPSDMTNVVKFAFRRDGKLMPSTNGMTIVVFEKSGANKNASVCCDGRLGGSLRARRLQRQQVAAEEKAKADASAAEKAAERPATAEEEWAQREAERVEQRRQLLAIQEELKRVRQAKVLTAKGACAVRCDTNKSTLGKGSVAEKLGECDFLLNKDFKKNAKVYLCLFSASWCGPCRREMPRIAKTYVETLKDDPDIELIHFSRDRDDEKAMAWAKEHDVKFPVVKPNGGNPLDLHSRGIPHLFIVKADGTLLEEGHPMRIFNEEKFREIKSGSVKPRTTSVNMKPRTPDVNVKDGERTEQVDGYTWTYRVENGGAEIVSEKGRYSCAVLPKPTGNLVIPSILGGVKMKSIGEHAFSGCKGLTSVTIPSSVTSIGKSAFHGCSGLTSVTIPSSVTSIGRFAFNWCSGLTTIVVDVDNPKYKSIGNCLLSEDGITLFRGSGSRCVVIPKGVTSIGENAFSGCKGLTSVTIPSSVTSIGRSAFSGCSGLTTIVVDVDNPRYKSIDNCLLSKDGITLIRGPESRCVVIPNGVMSIGEGAFSGCKGMTSVTIPSSVTSIGGSAFYGCKGLTSVTIPEGVRSISRFAFRFSGLTSVTIPSSVTSVGMCAFLECRGLTSVTIPSSVMSIEDSAFFGCSGLMSVTIPSSVTSIGRSAFYDCKGLTSVTMCGERPDVENEAFARCDKLAAIHVPSNAKSWEGMKEWQGIPLVFDAESKK